MLKYYFYIFTLVLSFYQATSFKCSSVKEEDFCQDLNGCEWENSKCKGDFITKSNARYVYPGSKAKGEENGDIETPFKSLKSAFASNISDLHYLIGINMKDQLFTVIDTILIEKEIKITALSKIEPMIIDIRLSNYSLHAFQVIGEDGDLTLDGCDLSAQDVYPGQPIIDVKNNSKLTLVNSQLSTPHQIPLSFIKLKYGKLNMTNFDYKGLCFQTILEGNYISGQTTLDNEMILHNISGIGVRYYCHSLFGLFSTKANISNSQFMDYKPPKNDQYIDKTAIFIVSGSNITFWGCEFNNIDGTLMIMNEIFQTNIVGSNFTNIQSPSLIRLQSIRPNTTLDSQLFVLISRCNFENITIGDSIIISRSMSINAFSSKFVNIYFDERLRNDYFESSQVGVVIYAVNEGYIQFNDTIFKNIYGNAIDSHDATVQINKCLWVLTKFMELLQNQYIVQRGREREIAFGVEYY